MDQSNEQPVRRADGPLKHGAARRPVAAGQRKPGRPGGYALGALAVIGFSLLAMLGFSALLLRPKVDPGVRVWMLNHTPDQCIIINPFDGVVEKKFLVADGLRELAFSADMKEAYIANVVDVSNRLTVIDTKTYLNKEVIEVDGVPQGIGVFPDGRRLAVILGSKTDFMAGGFDVIDLQQQSKADPKHKLRLYRERELALTHKIAVGDDGDRIYCIDAKESQIFVFSVKQRKQIGAVELNGAAEELYYPRAGQYYYVSVLTHQAIYQIDKQSDQVVAAYVYKLRDPSAFFHIERLRFMAIDPKAQYLFGTCMELKTVAIWRIGDPANAVGWEKVPADTSANPVPVFPVPYFLPEQKFKLKGGYDPNLSYIPGGQQIAVDPLNRYLYVVDENGKLYIYTMDTVLKAEAESTPEPHRLILTIEGEMRDLKVSNPQLLSGGSLEAP